jgi:DNA-binding NtrC family response regulator
MTSQSSVLIVEADIAVRHPLAEYLRECGYRVLEARNGEEARALLQAMASSIDIILADAASASENSFEFASAVRRDYPGVEIVLAGNAAKAVAKAGAICEDGPALVKPYDHQLVLDRIRRAIAAREKSRGGA